MWEGIVMKFEYAIFQYRRIFSYEAINIGFVLYCKECNFVRFIYVNDFSRLRMFEKSLDSDKIENNLKIIFEEMKEEFQDLLTKDVTINEITKCYSNEFSFLKSECDNFESTSEAVMRLQMRFLQ